MGVKSGVDVFVFSPTMVGVRVKVGVGTVGVNVGVSVGVFVNVGAAVEVGGVPKIDPQSWSKRRAAQQRSGEWKFFSCDDKSFYQVRKVHIHGESAMAFV